MSAPIMNESPNIQEVNHVHYAGFWLRFWAYLIDLIMIFSINGLLIKPVFRLVDLPISSAGMFTSYSIVSGIVFYAYFIIMTKISSQTIGKMIFGLKVVPIKTEKITWSAVIFRELIGRYISATILVAYVVVAFTNKKQGLHDLFADTTVISER